MSCSVNEGSRSYLHWLHFEFSSSIELQAMSRPVTFVDSVIFGYDLGH